MRFVLQTPSLQRIAQVKIVSALWSQLDILTQFAQVCNELPFYCYYSPETRKKWKEIKDLVKSKIWALPLPQPCKKQLLHCVEPLRWEILAWCWSFKDERDNYFRYILLGTQLLRWTMHGTVDYVKTAELIVKDERVDVDRRYEVACINCFEDEARQLIQFIPEERRREYINIFHTLPGVKCRFLVTYFTCTLSDQRRELLPSHFQSTGTESINKLLFRETLRGGNRATSEYFFEKLSPAEKEQVLVDSQVVGLFLLNQPITCNLMYYLSLMNEAQQRRMFEKYAGDVLVCLLRWPMQSLFMEAVECGWSYTKKYECSLVLSSITSKICAGFEDYDYVQLFRECWRLTRDDCKRHFLSVGIYLINLIKTKKDELVKLVLSEAPSFQISQLCKHNDEIRQLLMDESVISETALMECKQTAALISSNDKKDEEKRLRSEQVSRLVDMVTENKIKSREK